MSLSSLIFGDPNMKRLRERHARHKQLVDSFQFPPANVFRAFVLKRFVEQQRELYDIPAAPVMKVYMDMVESLYASWTDPAEYAKLEVPLPDTATAEEADALIAKMDRMDVPLSERPAKVDELARGFVLTASLMNMKLNSGASQRLDYWRDNRPPPTPFATRLVNACKDFEWLHERAQRIGKDFHHADGIKVLYEMDQVFERTKSRAYDSHMDELYADTRFTKLLQTEVPYELPATARRAHTMIVAGSDRGKTQTLEAMICADLTREYPPGMVVVDSKGDMFQRLSRLACFNPDDGIHRDRVILIDPRDMPALNPFDVNLTGDDEATGALISQLSYFFEALMGEALSGPMKTLLNPLAQLMVHTPGATLDSLLDAFDDVKRFSHVFPRLPPQAVRFFEKDFQIVAKATRDAVKARVYGVLNQSPALARMFNAPKNRLDMAAALDEGKTILVSSEEGYLHDASPIFARYMIACASAAALSRTKIPEDHRRQAYLYIDEAGPYFDERTPKLFRTLRSYGLGIVAAFQDFGQVDGTLRAAMLGSTSIKLAAGGSHDTASALYRDMNLEEPGFIFSQGFKHRSHTDWACYIRNETTKAITLRAPHGYLDEQPRMSDAQYTRFRGNNKAMLATTVPAPAPAVSAPPPAEDTPSGDWTR